MHQPSEFIRAQIDSQERFIASNRQAASMASNTLTVGEIAKRLLVSVETVAGWIRAGELKAVNVSRSRTSKKPRWRITQAALDAFEASRSASPEPPAPKRRKKPAGDVIEFYR